MKFALTAVMLSLFGTQALAHNHSSDVKELHPNEISVQHLPFVSTKTNRGFAPKSSSGAQVANSEEADIVIFYQPSFAAEHGEYEAFRRINAWIELANESYAYHGLNYKLNVNDIVPVSSISDDVPYADLVDENGVIVQDGAAYLFSLAVLNAGNPEYEIYQDKWGADLVVYVREKRDGDEGLGSASIGGELSNVLDDGGNPETYSTLAHEIGHNLGMNHEIGSASAGPEYARAWQCGGKRTIMYSASNRSLDLPHYSSPDLSNGGEGCGNAETGHNARVLKENFIPTTQRRNGVNTLGSVTFTGANFVGNEENGVTITLERDGDVSQAASVKLFANNGEALWGQDFVDTFVLAEFEAGASTTEVVYPIVEDTENEGVETFSVSMKYPYKLSIGNIYTATLSVNNSFQTGSAGVFSISGSSEFTEGDSAEYTISRVGGVGEVVVNVITTDGTATVGIDFVGLNEQLLFEDGQIEKKVIVSSSDDDQVEGAETLTIAIASSAESAEYDVQSIDVNLLDNDQVLVEPYAGTFSVSLDNSTVQESAGQIEVTINRANGSDGAVSLRVLTQDGSAVAGTDYTALDTTVEFADGETVKTLYVSIIDDSIDESGSNNFNVVIEGNDVDIDVSTVAVTIVDNDNSPSDGGTGASIGDTGSSSSSGGSTGFITMLLLWLTCLFRTRSKVNGN